MGKVRNVVLGGLAGWVIGLVCGMLGLTVLVWAWDTRTPEVVEQTCEPSAAPGVTGRTGWCVQRRHRDGLLTDERDTLWFVRYDNDTIDPRATVVGWPFETAAGELEAEFTQRGATVRYGNLSASYPAHFYARF